MVLAHISLGRHAGSVADGGSRVRSSAKHYLPQLDALRAVAAVAVVAFHTWGSEEALGTWRMPFFFALSGFLLGGIVLAGRERVRAGRTTARHFLGMFYARRALRLLPPLFLTILLAHALTYHTGESMFWHLAQATNIYIASQGDMVAGSLDHLWSLNVEEQICLVFPILVLGSNEVGLGVILLTWIILGYGVNALPAELALDPRVLPIQWIQCFALGVGLAASRFTALSSGFRSALVRSFLACVLVAWICAFWPAEPTGFLGAAAEFRRDALLLAVIAFASHTATRDLIPLLKWKPLVDLGRISYGFYLYHLPIWGLLVRLTTHFGHPFPRGPLAFVVTCILTFVAATLSWTTIEQRLVNLRSRFQY